MVICQKMAINFTKKNFWVVKFAQSKNFGFQNLPNLKILAKNLATQPSFSKVLLHKYLKFSKFHQELTQELKTQPGTNPGTKKSQELT